MSYFVGTVRAALLLVVGLLATVYTQKDQGFASHKMAVALWVLFAALLLITVLTIPPIRAAIPWVVVSRKAVSNQRVSDKGIGRRCLDLSEELNDELAEYKRTNPRTLNWGFGYPTPDTPEYAAQERAENEHRAKFEARFSQKYAARSAWLLDEIQRRGLADRRELGHAPSAGLIGDHGVSELADVLSVIGHRLLEDDGAPG